MMESIPEAAQERVVEELRALVEDARDEVKWDLSQKKERLIAAARKPERNSGGYGKRQWILTSCEIRKSYLSFCSTYQNLPDEAKEPRENLSNSRGDSPLHP
jgi:hypothetical protein